MSNNFTCTVCGSNDVTAFLEPLDYTVSKKRFQIHQCQSCQFSFTSNAPSEDEIGAYYESEEYISHTSTNKGIINKLYNRVRKINLEKKVSLIQSLSSSGNFVDYGAGTGHLVNLMIEKGMHASGFEPSENARQFAHDNFNLSLNSPDTFKEVSDNSLALVSLWHVLEHIHQLDTALSLFQQKIEHNGHLIIAVPNYLSHDAQKYGEYWAAYDVPRHLYHFSPKSVEKLLSKHGFSLVKTQPMKFDSYYVSMLSENYKSGNKSLANVIKGFMTGYSSNRKAASTNMYSSLIYIFKKR